MFEIVFRVVVVYVFFMLVFRLLGKRELSSLSPFELVTLMLIPETVSEALSRSNALINGLIGASTLFLLVIVSSVLAHRSKLMARLMEPSPSVLVENSRIVERALNRERIHVEDLFAEMHEHGYSRLSEIQFAILESGGQITFVPKRKPPHDPGEEKER